MSMPPLASVRTVCVVRLTYAVHRQQQRHRHSIDDDAASSWLESPCFWVQMLLVGGRGQIHRWWRGEARVVGRRCIERLPSVGMMCG